ncbi:alpha/beta fold hydrolase [Rhodococcus sp. NPDC059234]|uniref:alpha/beta hydrolase family protein n=1 Tax=Rhodococcus sp. NPDC059234 TaxID=3346781 RepID=UPI00366BAB2D
MTSTEVAGRRVTFAGRDGVVLGGHLFDPAAVVPDAPVVIVNCATGVLARYYHRYARFLAELGSPVLTYDYRGIGDSRPVSLRGAAIPWRSWGELDFDAAIAFALAQQPNRPLAVVGHSIGGFLVGLAPAAAQVDRMFTVGAQYAYWRDYARGSRLRLLAKWHLAMPALTAAYGYFPGRRLGWLEDLPAGVAYEWTFRRAAMESSYPRADRAEIRRRFAAVRAPILAVATTDDEFGTPAALDRTLGYYRGSERARVELEPKLLGHEEIGHFGLFHARHRDGFWRDTAEWLHRGTHPWTVARCHPAAR